MKQSITFRRKRLAVALSSALVPALAASGAYAQQLEEVGFFLDENIEEYWDLAKNGKNSSASIKQESIVNQHSFSQLIHYLSYAPQCVNQKY